MADILTWLSNYPLPIVLLIAVGAGFLYLLKMVTEKSIAQQFGRYGKSIELQLQRRSNFEAEVLMERFKLIREIKAKLDSIFTNINRLHHGTRVAGLLRKGDLVPLTEVFELLNSNRYLIPKSLFAVLDNEAQVALRFANAKDRETLDAVAAELQSLRVQFDQLMDEEFGLSRIRGAD